MSLSDYRYHGGSIYKFGRRLRERRRRLEQHNIQYNQSEIAKKSPTLRTKGETSILKVEREISGLEIRMNRHILESKNLDSQIETLRSEITHLNITAERKINDEQS